MYGLSRQEISDVLCDCDGDGDGGSYGGSYDNDDRLSVLRLQAAEEDSMQQNVQRQNLMHQCPVFLQNYPGQLQRSFILNDPIISSRLNTMDPNIH